MGRISFNIKQGIENHYILICNPINIHTENQVFYLLLFILPRHLEYRLFIHDIMPDPGLRFIVAQLIVFLLIKVVFIKSKLLLHI